MISRDFMILHDFSVACHFAANNCREMCCSQMLHPAHGLLKQCHPARSRHFETESLMNPLTRIATALRLRCPRCHDGKLFTGLLKMNATCPKCGLRLEPDPGFYLGSIYANYAATVLTATLAFMIFVFIYGWSKDSVIWWCAGYTMLFPLWFFRYARSIWLSLMYLVSSSEFNAPTSVSEKRQSALASRRLGSGAEKTVNENSPLC
jgi:uncharacterized protein (DUF983 family)